MAMCINGEMGNDLVDGINVAEIAWIAKGWIMRSNMTLTN